MTAEQEMPPKFDLYVYEVDGHDDLVELGDVLRKWARPRGRRFSLMRSIPRAEAALLARRAPGDRDPRWDAVHVADRMRWAIHELRWCKASDLLHAFAHDDTDEDGYREAFIRAVRTYAEDAAADLAADRALAADSRPEEEEK